MQLSHEELYGTNGGGFASSGISFIIIGTLSFLVGLLNGEVKLNICN